MQLTEPLGRRKVAGPPREPLYTMTEIADKLGVKMPRLRSLLLRRVDGAPKPRMRSGIHRNYVGLYKLSEFKTWMKLHSL